MRYRTREPIVIEAWQWPGVGETWHIPEDVEIAIHDDQTTAQLFVAAHGSWVVIEAGDYIIREWSLASYYPCRRDIFEQRYQKVDG